MKYILALLIISVTLPAFSGTYEDAMNEKKNVLLYLYTPHCRTCNEFSNNLKSITLNHKDYTCISVNAETEYGMKLMRKFHGWYVPYIVLSNPKTKKSVTVKPSCALDDMCMERVLNSFKG